MGSSWLYPRKLHELAAEQPCWAPGEHVRPGGLQHFISTIPGSRTRAPRAGIWDSLCPLTVAASGQRSDVSVTRLLLMLINSMLASYGITTDPALSTPILLLFAPTHRGKSTVCLQSSLPSRVSKLAGTHPTACDTSGLWRKHPHPPRALQAARNSSGMEQSMQAEQAVAVSVRSFTYPWCSLKQSWLWDLHSFVSCSCVISWPSSFPGLLSFQSTVMLKVVWGWQCLLWIVHEVCPHGTGITPFL